MQERWRMKRRRRKSGRNYVIKSRRRNGNKWRRNTRIRGRRKLRRKEDEEKEGQ